MDFVSDVFGAAHRFRILAIIDDYTRECLGPVAVTPLSGARVARELDRAVSLFGKPGTIVSVKGTELTSRGILEWQNDRCVACHYIAPSKPMRKWLRQEFQRQAA